MGAAGNDHRARPRPQRSASKEIPSGSTALSRKRAPAVNEPARSGKSAVETCLQDRVPACVDDRDRGDEGELRLSAGCKQKAHEEDGRQDSAHAEVTQAVDALQQRDHRGGADEPGRAPDRDRQTATRD